MKFPRRSLCTLGLLSLPVLVAPAAAPVGPPTEIAAGSGNYAATTSGASYILNAGNTRTHNSTEVITFGASSGTVSLTVNGTVDQTGGSGTRGIRTSNSASAIFNLTIGADGLVKAAGDDAIQARNGTFNLTNNGTIYSGPNLASNPTTAIATGQALDFASAIGGAVINNASGLIRADGHDAVRLGSNMTFTNHGTVRGNSVVNDTPDNNTFNTPPGSVAETFSASDAVSFEEGHDSSVINDGVISGSRHGVEAAENATNLTVTNNVGGQIIGRNGSGVGFDTLETVASRIVVNNYGLIRGEYAGVGNVVDRTGNASLTNDGDGDGIDIDGSATLHNYAGGQVLSTGAGGYDSRGRANSSEAIAIGGGVIVNEGAIQGADRGISVSNDSVASRSGSSATSITNTTGAIIEGLNGYAIRLENKLGDARDDDTIINAGTITGNGSIPDPDATIYLQGGTIVDAHSEGTLDGVTYGATGSARFIRGDGSAIQMGEGADVLTNTGTITGHTGRAINMEGGDDTVNFSGGTITGSINGGSGSDTLALGAGVSNGSAIQNFEIVNVATGSATLSGIVSGSAFSKSGAGSLILTGANTYAGGTTVTAGSLIVNNSTDSGTGAGNVTVDSGALIGGSGFIGGDLAVSGIVAPGNSIGTLTVNGDVTWNAATGNAWEFELGAGGTSDLLAVEGDFLRGSGTMFEFDFLSGGSVGTYVLVNWDGTTTFLASDFSYTNLAAGLAGTFAFNGSQLEFTTTAVPEPGTYAMFAGAAAIGIALWRRRRAA